MKKAILILGLIIIGLCFFYDVGNQTFSLVSLVNSFLLIYLIHKES